MKYILLILSLLTLSTKDISANSFTDKYGAIIQDIRSSAAIHKIPAKVLLSICYVESNFNTMALHKDDGTEDSVGLCQIQLRTAKSLGYLYNKKRLFENLFNTYFAAKYLKSLMNRYHSIDKAIVAYNLGHYSPNYKKYLIKVKKTMKFLKRVLPNVQ